MMFSKLSIFVAVTLAAFATAAGPLPQAQDGSSNVGNVKTNNVNGNNVNGDNVKTLSCPSSPVKCCKNKHQATSDDVKLAHDKLGVDISPSTEVWVGCIDFAQGNTCAGPTVCCDKSASDGSIAIGCTDAKA